MKLHLPKLLCVAMMGVLALPAMGETLWMNTENNNTTLDEVKGSDYETIIVKADSTIGKITANPAVNFINVQANLTVNSDVETNQINVNQYNGADSLNVNGNLTVNGALNVTGTNAVNVTGTTTLGGNTVSQLDGSAKLTTDKLIINCQTKLTAGGHIVANEVEVNDTLSPLDGSTITSATGTGGVMTVNEGAHVWQQGCTIDLETVVKGGQMTMYRGSYEGITLEEGVLNINGTITTGALTLDGGQLNFGAGAVLDLNGENLILSDNVSITVSVASLDEIATHYSLFKNVGAESTEMEDIAITFTDGEATKTVMASYNNGSLTIPEPTTATLSLLALAGLAVRRRRR